MFIARAGQNLNSMKMALIHELAADRRAGNLVSYGSGSMDSGDLASNEVEQHMNAMLSERERDRIIEIDHALKQIDEANYGVCDACGLEIAETRLEALPFTRHCCDCQQDQEREAKTRHRGNDIYEQRLREFTSPAEEDVKQEPKQSHKNGTNA